MSRKTVKVIIAAGTRPNFIKVAPLIKALDKHKENAGNKKGVKIDYVFVHTGQHYDKEMSKSFFDDLSLPRPDINLGVGSGSHAEQIGKIISKFGKVCLKEKPNLVIVVGDVNSTVACALAAAKLSVPVAHVEAGLRSFDRTMPEELNRVLTDQASDYLFATCEDACANLKREGIPEEKIYFVGNVMIDTLFRFISKIKANSKIGGSYALLTLHRPGSVDNRAVFKKMLEALRRVSKKIPIIFSAHPRTQKQIKLFKYEKYFNFLNSSSMRSINPKKAINLLNALPYPEFMALLSGARLVLTDSGGIQEETTILGIPCLTLRTNTERPITVKEGTNIITGNNPDKIVKAAFAALKNKLNHKKNPKYWDGKASERIVNILARELR